MSVLSDTVAQKVVTALTAVATAQSATGPYQQVVPQGAAFPRIVFQIENDTPQLDTPREAIDVVFSVRAISTVSFKSADTIMSAVDAALDDINFTITGWTVYWQKREASTPRLADPRDGGGYYFQTGAVYRVRVAKDS
jgi:hypothetical protein